ncbi:MAG: serine hydrolase [Caldivirga sp.]
MDCVEGVRGLLRGLVKDAYPGASLVVMANGEVIMDLTVGYAQLKPVERELRGGMLFDLASLTKALSTSIIVMRLVERGVIHLTQRVSDVIPEFSTTNAGFSEVKDKVRVWMLLSHTSGLPAWLPLYKSASSRDEVIKQALTAFPVYEPGSRVVYSDLNYIVLTALVEKLTGQRIDSVFNEMVAEPLGLERTLYNPLTRFSRDEIVATEYVNEANDALVGIVHDENARAMGGVSGHAGLFATAEEAARIGNALLESYRNGTFLSRPSIRSMWTPWACGESCYGLGWQVYRRGVTTSGGDLLTDGRAFGHTGFTGTSIWVDTELNLVITLFTNRVHPTRDNRRIDYARPVIHNAVVSCADRLIYH